MADLQKKLGAPVVAYIASTTHPLAALTQQDVPLFLDLIQVAKKQAKKVYLILQSPGGDGNTAEKLVELFRAMFPEGFNVIIPQFAKSAATMISVGSDNIVMGEPSELGPIDPQVPMPLPSGQMQFVPAKAYVGIIDEIMGKVKIDPSALSTYYPILQQIKPEMIKYCEDMIGFTEDFAKRWLPKGAMKGRAQADIDRTILELVKGDRFRIHGSVINHAAAKDTLKMEVEYWPLDDPRWAVLWEYYLRVASTLINPIAAKTFETTESSMTMNIQVLSQPPQKQGL